MQGKSRASNSEQSNRVVSREQGLTEKEQRVFDPVIIEGEEKELISY